MTSFLALRGSRLKSTCILGEITTALHCAHLGMLESVYLTFETLDKGFG